jgi:uncharacterized protein (TIGR01244 family)
MEEDDDDFRREALHPLVSPRVRGAERRSLMIFPKSLSSAILALALILARTAGAQIPESMDPAEVANYRVVRPGLATGGKPSPETLERLMALGFKTIVDLRTESEGTAAEKQAVEAQGLRYVSVPISAATFSVADVEAVAKVLNDPATAPVLLHCATANRVGAVWAVLQVQEGRSLEDAEAAGQKIGLTSPVMVEAMKRVATSLPVKQPSSP